MKHYPLLINWGDEGIESESEMSETDYIECTENEFQPMNPEAIELLQRYEVILKLPFIPNPYFKNEYTYKNEIRDKIKEIKLLNNQK